VYVRRGRWVLPLQLFTTGTASADGARAAIPLPPDIDPPCIGAVPGELADAGIIRLAGYVRTARPIGHAGPGLRWQLADRAEALAWLASNPALPDAASEQRTLWP
jgi:hypothetical protein